MFPRYYGRKFLEVQLMVRLLYFIPIHDVVVPEVACKIVVNNGLGAPFSLLYIMNAVEHSSKLCKRLLLFFLSRMVMN